MAEVADADVVGGEMAGEAGAGMADVVGGEMAEGRCSLIARCADLIREIPAGMSVYKRENSYFGEFTGPLEELKRMDNDELTKLLDERLVIVFYNGSEYFYIMVIPIEFYMCLRSEYIKRILGHDYSRGGFHQWRFPFSQQVIMDVLNFVIGAPFSPMDELSSHNFPIFLENFDQFSPDRDDLISGICAIPSIQKYLSHSQIISMCDLHFKKEERMKNDEECIRLVIDEIMNPRADADAVEVEAPAAVAGAGASVEEDDTDEPVQPAQHKFHSPLMYVIRSIRDCGRGRFVQLTIDATMVIPGRNFKVKMTERLGRIRRRFYVSEQFFDFIERNQYILSKYIGNHRRILNFEYLQKRKIRDSMTGHYMILGRSVKITRNFY